MEKIPFFFPDEKRIEKLLKENIIKHHKQKCRWKNDDKFEFNSRLEELV